MFSFPFKLLYCFMHGANEFINLWNRLLLYIFMVLQKVSVNRDISVPSNSSFHCLLYFFKVCFTYMRDKKRLNHHGKSL